MSTRISTGLGGTFNKELYYSYCNNLIETMRSGGISETSIANAYKQYDENCNISNTYYFKFFPKIDFIGDSYISFVGGCYLLPIIDKGENNSKPILWRDSSGRFTLYICSNKQDYNDRSWKGKTVNNIAQYYSDVYGSKDIYDRIDVSVINKRITDFSLLEKGENLYNSTESN